MQATRTTHLGVFCLSASMLLLQVALTRVFSVMLWNHFTFLVISIALLGLGAAGSYLAVRRREPTEAGVRRTLRRNCLLFGVTAIGSTMLVARLGLDSTRVFLEMSSTLKLAMVYAMVATPFFFGGLSICVLLSVCSRQVNTIYFADLAGGGLGALAVTLMLGSVGAPAAVVIACALAALAGALFDPGGRAGSFGAMVAFGVLVVLVAVLDPWHIPVAPGKPLGYQRGEVTDSRWTLHGRIDIIEPQRIPLNFGSGVSNRLLGRRVTHRHFFVDGSNPSRLLKYDQERWFLKRVLTAGPYSLGLVEPRVLVIGAGGGGDVMVGLEGGAGRITAVEINPTTVDFVQNDYADFIGNVFADPRVTLLAREGRHFLSMDDSRYDIIRLTGVDTRAASAVGANALDHVYLYTQEAIRDLYAHLGEDGVLAITRPNGWQTLRLANLIVHSLAEDRSARIGEHVVVITNGRWSDLMIRRRPYRREEVDKLERWAEESALLVTFDPFEKRDLWLDQILWGSGDVSDRARPAESSGNLQPVTDDSPFFFERYTLGEILGQILRFEISGAHRSGYLVLLMALLQALVLGALFILFPLWKNRIGAGPAERKGASFAYFSLLGLGFILVEVVLIQKYMILLGGPAYAMSVTLFSILVFSGLGAYTAKRIRLDSGRTSSVAPLAVAVLILASAFFLEWGLPKLLGLGFAARVGLGVATMAPLSFALGLPFPVGIRLLDRHAPQLIPWAWACNGCLSVVGSVLAVILSMQWGFSTVLATAGGCYVFAALSLGRMAGMGWVEPAR